jgi:hypothetical protein
VMTRSPLRPLRRVRPSGFDDGRHGEASTRGAFGLWRLASAAEVGPADSPVLGMAAREMENMPPMGAAAPKRVLVGRTLAAGPAATGGEATDRKRTRDRGSPRRGCAAPSGRSPLTTNRRSTP